MVLRIDRFTERAQDAAQRALEVMARYGHTEIDTEHLLVALLEQPEGVIPKVLKQLDVDVDQMQQRLDGILKAFAKQSMRGRGGIGQVFITPRVKRVLDQANDEANKLKDKYISTEHIFLSIASERKTPVARLLHDLGVTKERIHDAIKDVRGGQRVTDRWAETRYHILEQYSRDLTSLALEGSLDPVIGREEEINRIARILSQRKRNCPLLVGDAGVGKTAIVHGLAQRIVTEDVPRVLIGKTVKLLDPLLLVGGTKFRGEMEEKVTAIIQEVQSSGGSIVLVIDDLQEHLETGSAAVLNAMQSAIAQGDIQMIGVTRLEGYEKYFGSNTLLGHSFAPIPVREISLDETITVLRALRSTYETHHQIEIADEAIEAAVRLSDQYIKDRYQPDKSIRIIDEAAAGLHLVLDRLPPHLQDDQDHIEKLREEIELASRVEDYKRAAEIKLQLEQLELSFEQRIDDWQKRRETLGTLTADEILKVVSISTGIRAEDLSSGATPLSDHNACD
jgi:ATP-dependent Clp protease ATP-binding subunit ClpC